MRNLAEPLWGLLWVPSFVLAQIDVGIGPWNPEFAALGRFAAANNLQIRVRFWTWGSIFDALQGAIAGGGLPDVSQVGSGWIGYLQGRRSLEPFGEVVGPGARRDIAGVLGVSLRYANDVRLLFFGAVYLAATLPSSRSSGRHGKA